MKSANFKASKDIFILDAFFALDFWRIFGILEYFFNDKIESVEKSVQ
jgi:hypothetical protein